MIGSGSETNPYQIWDANHLNEIRSELGYSEIFCIQKADIDLEGWSWEPLGDSTDLFSGSYDGNNFKIKNVFINKPTSSGCGLFGKVDNKATLKNIYIENIKVIGSSRVGGLFGCSYCEDEGSKEEGIIKNCHIRNGEIIGSGEIEGDVSEIGGLIGENYGMFVENCTFQGKVNNVKGYYTGGFIGSQYGRGSIKRCSCNSNVEGKFYVAGFISWKTGEGNIRDCVSIGNIQGEDNIGGFICRKYGIEEGKYGANIENCYSIADIFGSDYIGGFICNKNGVGFVKNCYFIGNIDGKEGIGGFISYKKGKGSIEGCHAKGEIYGITNTGGFIAYNYGKGNIEKCSFNGIVEGVTNVGGFIGMSEACEYMEEGNFDPFIKNNYVIGDVSGEDTVAGFINLSDSGGKVENCYYAGEVSGEDNVGVFIGEGEFTNCYYDKTKTGVFEGEGSPKSSEEMVFPYSNIEDTYIGWNFEQIWQHDDSDNNHAIYLSLRKKDLIVADCSIYGENNYFLEYRYLGHLLKQDYFWDNNNLFFSDQNVTNEIKEQDDLLYLPVKYISQDILGLQIKNKENRIIIEGQILSNINQGYPYILKKKLFNYGSGEKDDPFQVWTHTDLNNIKDRLDEHFIQMADIDLGYKSSESNADKWFYKDNLEEGIKNKVITDERGLSLEISNLGEAGIWDLEIGGKNGLIGRANIKSITNTDYETAQEAYEGFCEELEIDSTISKGTFNSDDEQWIFSGATAPNMFKGLVDRFNYSSEGSFGLYDAIPSSTSRASVSINDVSRMFTSNSKPLFLFTFHPNEDLRSEDTKWNGNENGYCIYARHKRWSGTSVEAFNVAIKVDALAGKITFFYEKDTVSTFNMYLCIFEGNNTTNSTVYNQYMIGKVLDLCTTMSIEVEFSSDLIPYTYEEEGFRISTPINIVENQIDDTTILRIDQNLIEGTGSEFYIASSNDTLLPDEEDFIPILKDEYIPGGFLDKTYLWIKQKLITSDTSITPFLKSSSFIKEVLNWEPIGDFTKPFVGNFNGDKFIIKNLTIHRPEENFQGLFGYVEECSLHNISLVSSQIEGNNYIGSLVGYGTKDLSIEGCVVEGEVNGNRSVGGMAGYLESSYPHIIGYCKSKGNFSGNSYVGGIVGEGEGRFYLSDSSFLGGIIKGETRIGGIAGSHKYEIRRCTSSGKVIGTGDYIGGIVGRTEGSLGLTQFNGKVEGKNYIGGIVGYTTSYLQTNYSIGSIKGNFHVGGLCGYVNSFIYNSYSRGIVIGNKTVGGLIGEIYRQVYYCYSTSEVKGNSIVGGLIGVSNGTASESYWNTETSGVTVSAVGEGKTTNEMVFPYGEGVYGGWDIEVWCDDPSEVNDGYPCLHELLPLDVFSRGKGTIVDPYQIYHLYELKKIKYQLNAYFKLMNYISFNSEAADPLVDYEGKRWEPIGTEQHKFTGVFDGNNYIIGGLDNSNYPSDYIGLFGCISSTAKIFDLGLQSLTSKGGYIVGGLVSKNYGLISNCFIKNSTIEGGLYSEIIGGLVGINLGTISHCYSKDTFIKELNSEYSIGGLIGINKGEVDYCYSKSEILCIGSDIGGLVGKNEGNISNSYTETPIVGGFSVGGLVGENDTTGHILSCYSIEKVKGETVVGGLVGENKGEVALCYSVGEVEGGSLIGGLIGSNEGIVTSSYWDIDTSTQESSNGGEGRTTEELSSSYDPETTYVGWDFLDIWQEDETTFVNNGYPNLSEIPPKDVYLIWSAEDLYNMRNNLKGHYYQMADIDLSSYSSGQGWEPIGEFTSVPYPYPVPYEFIYLVENQFAFSGSFNGNNHTISNLTINKPGEEKLGLFGYAVDGSLSNITLLNVNILGGEETGSLAGRVQKLESIKDCKVTGSIVSYTQYSDVGGLIGRVDYHPDYYDNPSAIFPIYNCSTDCNIIGDSAGGLIGENYGASLSNCYATGDVTGLHRGICGGLNGWNGELCVIDNCYTTGNIYSIENSEEISFAAGLLGWNEDNTPITNCFTTGSILLSAESSAFVAGLIGWNETHSPIVNCFTIGDLFCLGGAFLAGLIGWNEDKSPVTNCFTTGNMIGETYSAAGLIAWNDPECHLTDCSTTGNIAVSNYWGSYVGGLVGYNMRDTNVIRCYATGNLLNECDENSSMGGLIASVNRGSLIKDCYATGNITDRVITTSSYAGGNGGLIGEFYGDEDEPTTVKNCYSTGKITTVVNETTTGGMVGTGWKEAEDSFINSYWDIETSERTTSLGGEGRTTKEMTFPYMEGTYVDWNFIDLWKRDNPSSKYSIDLKLKKGQYILGECLTYGSNAPFVEYKYLAFLLHRNFYWEGNNLIFDKEDVTSCLLEYKESKYLSLKYICELLGLFVSTKGEEVIIKGRVKGPINLGYPHFISSFYYNILIPITGGTITYL